MRLYSIHGKKNSQVNQRQLQMPNHTGKPGWCYCEKCSSDRDKAEKQWIKQRELLGTIGPPYIVKTAPTGTTNWDMIYKFDNVKDAFHCFRELGKTRKATLE